MSLIFYTNPRSRGQIARWALHEAGADYEQHIVGYDGEMKGSDYLAVNPMGKVPAIVHDGKVVTECAAICAYLADAFPGSGLAPQADERADYYRWLFFAAGPLEQAITAEKILKISPSEEQRRSVGFDRYETVVGVLEDMLASRDYVCGDRFTMADVYVGSHVGWGTMFGTLPSSPVFEAYRDRVMARDAFRAAKAIDEELGAATPA